MRTTSVFLSLLFSAIPLAAVSGEPSHHHHGADAVELQLNNGERWATDEALRESMAGIRGLLASRLDAIHADTLDADGYAAIATGVERQVDRMIRSCRLPPAADAELHKLIAMLMDGVQQMRDGPSPRDGAVQVVTALTLYGEYFAHEGWQPLVA